MNTKEIIAWLNHSLTINWDDNLAKARDILEGVEK